jgi:hypothetical protein
LKDVFFAAALHAAAKNTLSPGDVEKVILCGGAAPTAQNNSKEKSILFVFSHSHLPFVCLVVS